MLEFGIIDGIVDEPLGGAHSNPDQMVRILKKHIKNQILELSDIPADKLIDQRIDKYASIGHFDEVAKS